MPPSAALGARECALAYIPTVTQQESFYMLYAVDSADSLQSLFVTEFGFTIDQSRQRSMNAIHVQMTTHITLTMSLFFIVLGL